MTTITEPTVYASAGGLRYHATADCRALRAGQESTAWQITMFPYPLHEAFPTTATEAFGAGKTPCAVCLPAASRAWARTSSEDDFGHEPVPLWWERSLAVCARCEVDHGEPVLWPCTTAVVLGLVPRAEAQQPRQEP